MANVAPTVHRANQRLCQFFEGEGRELFKGLGITIKYGSMHGQFGYMAVVEPQNPPITKLVDIFWDRYLDPWLSNVIVYSQPLFFQGNEGGRRDFKKSGLA